MKQITIEGKLKNAVNFGVAVEVYCPNNGASQYDFYKKYHDDFVLTLTDLDDNTLYHIDITGFVFAGSIDFTISGNITNTVTGSYTNTSFSPGYLIQTNP